MRIITSFILIITIGVLSFFTYFQLNKIVSPCDTVKTYRIGVIDPRFNLTKGELKSSSNEAANLWNSAYPGQLLQYDPTGEIIINMIFDERQSFVSEINSLENSLEGKEQNIESKNQDFERQAAQFETKKNNLNNEIQKWNNEGGASPDVYQSLIQQQNSLNEEAQRLNNLARKLNRSVVNYNAEIGNLNQTVTSFNETLEDKPEGGLFVGLENKIEIYIDNSPQDLNRILAHELGHALGINHVNNDTSIMYPIGNNQSTLSSQDISALKNACQGIKVLEILKIRLSDFVQESLIEPGN